MRILLERVMSAVPIAACLAALSAGSAFAQTLPWPGSGGVDIGQVGLPGKLPAGYEPSGAAWHAGLQRLLVVGDDGELSSMDRDGGGVITWNVGGDLEAVTAGKYGSSRVYLGREHPDAVIEFDLATGSRTGAEWNLQLWLNGPADQGLEGLTYANGLFYAGLQKDGATFVFDLQPGGVVVHLGTIPPHAGRNGLSGLHYDDRTDVLHTIHSSYNVIVERTLTGTFLREYALPGGDQEGLALIPCCTVGEATVYVADDNGALWKFEDYPITCPAGPFKIYCTAGTSANGCRASISASGTASATAASGFTLSAADVEGGKDGLFFYGANGKQANPWGNGTSYQCVAFPVRRGGLLSGLGAAGNCDGSFSLDLNARWCPTCPKPSHAPAAGAAMQAQLWYRDPQNTSNQTTGLSDAVEFCVGP